MKSGIKKLFVSCFSSFLIRVKFIRLSIRVFILFVRSSFFRIRIVILMVCGWRFLVKLWRLWRVIIFLSCVNIRSGLLII